MGKKDKVVKAKIVGQGMPMGKVIALTLLANIIVLGVWYYVAFPALNIHNTSFWGTLIVVFTIDFLIVAAANSAGQTLTGMGFKQTARSFASNAVVLVIIDFILVMVVVIGSVLGAKIFRARSYSKLLTVDTRDFNEDVKESTTVTNIALMDTASAKIFGNREIGSLSDVVSQYEVESGYNQISLGGVPMKVSPLKYASFFKWMNNRNSGVPGYVKVNPVNSDAKYEKLNQGLKYVPSAFLNDNLMRHVQFKFPTKIISGHYFEIDEEGNPYFICPCLTAKIGLFNGMDVEGVIICDPITGDATYYKTGDIPNWVDHVYDGDLCARKYDWHGIYSGGFWNTVFSQTGCTKTTDDYGYIIIDDDVWMYTGVTSLNADNSNVGFVMINERTSEARYYVVSGAEEDSAMHSAEGAVQEKNYQASFPSLINVAGQPTYIMVLKDSGGLVKMYAMVNVEQYNIVATATSQSEVFKEYKKMLKSEGVKNTGEAAETIKVNATIADIQYIVNDGETTVYIKDTNHRVYSQSFAENEELITLSVGDYVTFELSEMSELTDTIISIKGFKVISRS